MLLENTIAKKYLENLVKLLINCFRASDVVQKTSAGFGYDY